MHFHLSVFGGEGGANIGLSVLLGTYNLYSWHFSVSLDKNSSHFSFNLALKGSPSYSISRSSLLHSLPPVQSLWFLLKINELRVQLRADWYGEIINICKFCILNGSWCHYPQYNLIWWVWIKVTNVHYKRGVIEFTSWRRYTQTKCRSQSTWFNENVGEGGGGSEAPENLPLSQCGQHGNKDIWVRFQP